MGPEIFAIGQIESDGALIMRRFDDVPVAIQHEKPAEIRCFG